MLFALESDCIVDLDLGEHVREDARSGQKGADQEGMAHTTVPPSAEGKLADQRGVPAEREKCQRERGDLGVSVAAKNKLAKAEKARRQY